MKKFILISLISFFTVSSAFSAKQTYTASIKSELSDVMEEVTPAGNSVLEEKLDAVKHLERYPLSLALFRPTYVLPYYDTTRPYTSIYEGNTPNNEGVKNAELKAQLSFLVPIVQAFDFNKRLSLNIAYTQLSYWQVYVHSQYFRETNYEPEIFFDDHFYRNWLFRIGLNHQSNGRGGDLERSWNRLIGMLELSGDRWIVDLTVWNLIFKSESSDVHNPKIAHYLGYDSLLVSTKLHDFTASVRLQNLESLLSRGNIMTTLSYPLNKRLSLYVEYFTGFGQSLIEYDHRTQGLGLGIAFNDWV